MREVSIPFITKTKVGVKVSFCLNVMPLGRLLWISMRLSGAARPSFVFGYMSAISSFQRAHHMQPCSSTMIKWASAFAGRMLEAIKSVLRARVRRNMMS